ncbi:Putative monooxygenase ycnE [Providencia rustigianii]|uniref:Antibiotic biosynthesis monooxygenase n=2 Tax=Providencia rustigianii TaxID=158850 RepID=D1NY55_9GAMM|nr:MULTISPECIES: putative quinol monooxygenase [Providencia]EFB73903.1 antibiotic biosynthesis monooxygenase [Providencia rustigianii DSM 4541]MTC57244.1 antibiotic biosynthesis monooxygenase [Providencia rustigianii]MTC60815.1 antibiotic biosynthesis monooxygenase [Providencia rustigianii]SPY77362.1 Putative monooxygenase ycnE [Providencia rustigianii]SUC26740.1 Putative monooxygenase ycnE [Providencia rustigianii]
MSIVVYAQITTEKTDGYLTKKIVRDIAKHSRREKGCLQYDLMAKENGYIVFEEWESRQDLEMYQNSVHFKRLVDAIERDNAIFSVNFSEKL